MSRPMWFVDLIKHFYPDRFTVAGWTRTSPVMKAVIEKTLFEGDDTLYLPKDNVYKEALKAGLVKERIPINQPIIKEDVVLPSDVVRHFIKESKHLWINNWCMCRDSMKCKDYPIDIGCMFMGEPVLGINPELGRLVSVDEANDHLDKAIDHGFIHMIGRNKIDTQWMGISPGDKLLSVCNCCECCCLYKVLPSLDRDLSARVQKMPGVRVVVDEDTCIGCGKCTEGVCFTNAINLQDDVAVINEYCLGCGRCVEACPTDAIELSIHDEQFADTAIKHLLNATDPR